MPSVYKEPRKTIAVNLDDTLSHTLEALLDWHNLCYGTNNTMTDLNSLHLHDIWGGTPEDTCDKIRQFYQSEHFVTIEPIMDFALEALKMLKKRRFHLVIITSRQQFIAEETKRFVDKHYPGIFESIYFCNLGLSDEEQLEYISKRKATICHEIGVDVLIDHQLEHCFECAEAGVDVLLYDRKGQYKWNHQPLPITTNHPNIHRVTTWRDIIQRHFPKPNSPLRHLVYPYNNEDEDDITCDEDDDDLDCKSLDQHEDDDDWDMMIV
ncbi:hypothetical protein BCR42DRAFT_361216 [Absidia repens]|uniref:Nucleotidase n=1 Tax=Absidia repens TaxID=90262 RepID=A0A1X2I070_9FUNG|nr:hypothetical protein BCR42DRAFT_361216 [Absidia repens]